MAVQLEEFKSRSNEVISICRSNHIGFLAAVYDTEKNVELLLIDYRDENEDSINFAKFEVELEELLGEFFDTPRVLSLPAGMLLDYGKRNVVIYDDTKIG